MDFFFSDNLFGSIIFVRHADVRRCRIDRSNCEWQLALQNISFRDHALSDFDSEALLRELARCRETANQIPITNPNATHFGIQLTVNALYNLEENLRYLLHLHREGQRSFRKKHDEDLQQALSQPHNHDHQPQARRGNARQRVY